MIPSVWYEKSILWNMTGCSKLDLLYHDVQMLCACLLKKTEHRLNDGNVHLWMKEKILEEN